MGFWKRSIIRLIKRIGLLGVKVDVLRNSVYEEIDYVYTLLEQQQVLLRAIRLSLVKPGKMSLNSKELLNMPTREFICALSLPTLSAPDVVLRTLSIQLLDSDSQPVGEPTVHELVEPELSSLKSPEFQLPYKQKFIASIVDTDADHNNSQPHTQEFVVIDTIAPPEPGTMGVLVLREVQIADPVPPVNPV